MTNKEGAGGPDPNPAKDDSAKRNNTSQLEEIFNEHLPGKVAVFFNLHWSELSTEQRIWAEEQILQVMDDYDPRKSRQRTVKQSSLERIIRRSIRPWTSTTMT